MMTNGIETLRQAASLMRKLSDKADAQPVVKANVEGVWLNSRFYMVTTPARERAVADWLDACAEFVESEPRFTWDGEDHALNIARAYLGEES